MQAGIFRQIRFAIDSTWLKCSRIIFSRSMSFARFPRFPGFTVFWLFIIHSFFRYTLGVPQHCASNHAFLLAAAFNRAMKLCKWRANI
jgi:hypothetical protein